MADYFDKKRALAIGIANSGAGFGTIIMAPVIYFLDEKFGWSWTLMILGVMMLFYIPLCLLFKPIKHNQCQQSIESWREENEMGDKRNSHDSVATSRCSSCIPTAHIGLFHDSKFMIFMLSNLLANIGFAVPFAFTQVKKNIFLKSLSNK